MFTNDWMEMLNCVSVFWSFLWCPLNLVLELD
jgi:hypothetical protein